MSLFANPEVHEANPPESWHVVKVRERSWVLTTKSGIGTLDQFPTKRQAEEAKRSGFLFDLWHQESAWYAGAEIPGWRPYAEPS